MPPRRDPEYIASLVNELRHLPGETEWVEFKVNNDNPQDIGEYISALANGSALIGKPSAYQVWGIEDSTHDIVGTNFSPSTVKIGNEPLENWLLRSLRPHIDFRFHEIPIDEKRVVLMEIEPASHSPVAFNNDEFIRVGSVKKRLRDFPRLGRKTLRIIQYKGTGRIETLKEQTGLRGYAAGFEGMVDYIMALVPSNEVFEQALRRTVPMFPDIAIRELVANALIHQDFTVSGTGPMVEIFDDRIEITNPGAPLVDTLRFVDTPPKSRNEDLAALMRRLGFCEERGSGIDKVVFEVEMRQLPAPLFEAPGKFTRATLFAHKDLALMDRPERVHACYLHACLRYVNRQPMNNTSIRERFGLPQKKVAVASRLLREALDSEAIIIRNPEAGTKNRTYLPFWAA